MSRSPIVFGALLLSLIVGPWASLATEMTAAIRGLFADGTKVRLNLAEGRAFMFLNAIATLEGECLSGFRAACPLSRLVTGFRPANGQHTVALTSDPQKEQDYSYAVTVSGARWAAAAVPRRPGLGGFLIDSTASSQGVFFNPKGPATPHDRMITAWHAGPGTIGQFPGIQERR